VPSAGPAPEVSTPPQPGAAVRGIVVLATSGKPPASGGVVYFEDAPKHPGVATSAFVEIRRKEFSPFISVVTTGGSVTFDNQEALVHHVFSPDVQLWDTGYLRKEETSTRTFDAPGSIALLCNIHPEMLGYVLVVPSSYFGKFEADGRYVIQDVPPGTYHARAWVPRWPAAAQVITVGTSGIVEADFTLTGAGAGK
jgi:plastocyanin